MTEANGLPADGQSTAPNGEKSRTGGSGTARTVLVSFAVCLLCSLAVSVSTMVLRPIRLEREKAERQARVLEVLARQPDIKALIGDLGSADIEQLVIELSSGERADLDAADFDAKAAAEDEATGRAIAKDKDPARIGRQAKHAVVTVIRRDDAISAVVLPVYGRGYASIIEASVAVAGDGNTIVGLVIHGHGETPGIGSEIEDERWRAQWSGKKIRDGAGEVAIRVVTDASKDVPAAHRVDGISGATRSSEGVSELVRFWMSEQGYGPFVRRLAEGDLR